MAYIPNDNNYYDDDETKKKKLKYAIRCRIMSLSIFMLYVFNFRPESRRRQWKEIKGTVIKLLRSPLWRRNCYVSTVERVLTDQRTACIIINENSCAEYRWKMNPKPTEQEETRKKHNTF